MIKIPVFIACSLYIFLAETLFACFSLFRNCENARFLMRSVKTVQRTSDVVAEVLTVGVGAEVVSITLTTTAKNPRVYQVTLHYYLYVNSSQLPVAALNHQRLLKEAHEPIAFDNLHTNSEMSLLASRTLFAVSYAVLDSTDYCYTDESSGN